MGACAVLLLAGGLLTKERLLEEWYLWRLESSIGSVRLAAAEKLAAMKSVRAVRVLMRLIQGDPREQALLQMSLSVGSPSGLSAITLDSPTPSVASRIELTPLAHALYQIGPGALPVIEKTLRLGEIRFLKTPRDRDSPSHWRLLNTLVYIKEALRCPTREVQRCAYSSPEVTTFGIFLPPALEDRSP
jgi:hypothetical protein